MINNKIKDSSKKILCHNMLNKQKCNYGHKCMYAHSLKEQKIDPLRHKIYTLITRTSELCHIDLINDNVLYENLLQLTRICSLCNKSQCPGGYNCRNGAISFEYKVCYDDLVYGNCKKRPICQSVHLTDKGLIPYMKQKYHNEKKAIALNINTVPNIELNNNTMLIENMIKKEQPNDNEIREIFPIVENEIEHEENNTKNIDSVSRPKYRKLNYRKIIENNKNNKMINELDNVQGILLTENFFSTYSNNKLRENDSTSDSEVDSKEVEKMIEYFNNDMSDDDPNESIFIE